MMPFELTDLKLAFALIGTYWAMFAIIYAIVKQFNSLTQQQEAGNGAEDKGKNTRLHRIQRGAKIPTTDTDALEHERDSDAGGSVVEDSQLHAKDGIGRRAK